MQSCAFVVVSEKRRLVIGTASVEERNSWISLINAAIKASAFVTNSDQFGDFSEEDDLDVAVTPTDGQPGGKDDRDNAGWLEKLGQSKKEWNKRWFVQKGPVLTYYADNKVWISDFGIWFLLFLKRFFLPSFFFSFSFFLHFVLHRKPRPSVGLY